MDLKLVGRWRSWESVNFLPTASPIKDRHGWRSWGLHRPGVPPAEQCILSRAGWGGPVGYVYQKANVEFFCLKEKLNALIEKCKAFPSLTYTAVNKEGSWISNVSSQTDANAVTWGVFPAKEIIQPTVVDPSSFIVWKDEPFEIWSRGWVQLYPEGDPSRKLLEEVQISYSLINLVDNDYVDSDLFAVFKEL